MTCTSNHSGHFEVALERLLGVEGGFSNDPLDPGKATNYGITEDVARAWGYTGPMRELPPGTAAEIYHELYWEEVRGDQLAAFDFALAWEVFEVGVNCGTEEASLWLQRLLNALNQGGTLYADIAEDGVIGPVTLGAIDEYYDERGERGLDVLSAAFNCIQGAFYLELCRSDNRFEKFIYGWLDQRVIGDERP